MLLDKIRNKFQLRLKDRATAGNILGEALKDVIKSEKERRESTTVLGIPRGGVIVADLVTKKMSCRFDIIIPRKLRAPHNEELAIGAVMGDGSIYLNEDIIKKLDITQDYIEKEKSYQIQEIERRSSSYRNVSTLAATEANSYLEGMSNIILVDDGAASGATIISAARWVKNNYAFKKLIIAVPVAPTTTKSLLDKEANLTEVIITPSISKFESIGQYYQSFDPISDEQVLEIMAKNKTL